MLHLSNLRVNAMAEPIGIGSEIPVLGWWIESDGQSVLQGTYRLQVSADPEFSSLLWDSGDVQSRENVQIPYSGKALSARTAYFWRVRIADQQGNASDWSDTASFETGLWGDDWAGAQFISPQNADDPQAMGGFYLRREFQAKRPIVSARAYVTAHGVYHLTVNGKKISDAAMLPGWTNYEKRLQVQTFDITGQLTTGANALLLHIGPGWYKSNLANWIGSNNRYGDCIAALVRIVVRYADGGEENIVSGPDWLCKKSPVLESSIYDGEVVDMRLEPKGVGLAGFDSTDWTAARMVEKDFATLIPQEGAFVKEQDVLKPVNVFTTPEGDTVIDFGQIITGWVRLRLNAKPGDTVIYDHAEILAQGNFYTENLRGAKQRIEYTAKGGGEETYTPYFSFQGFRYIRVKAFPGELDISAFEAVAVHSDMERIGEFTCSDEMVNQLMRNVLWGMKGNFLDVPTDCPQRDERLGWTGDAQIFAATAMTLMDGRRFFTKWLGDVASEQQSDGSVPHVVPDVLSRRSEKYSGGACGWADAAVIVPWRQYMAYGDLALLQRQYPSMKAWVEYIRANAEDGMLWNSGFHFGDWLALDAAEGSYRGATPNDLSATAYYAYSTGLLALSAQALGMDEDAKAYADLRTGIEEAYRKAFIGPDGGLTVKTQTAHVLSLVFDLVTPAQREKIAKDLVQMVEEAGHLTTGFLGTPALCYALSNNGALDTAYRLLLRKEYPSWLYPITKGATTIWEHWDGLKPDGTMWSADMNSFNHYAYGAIGQWLFTEVAGVSPAEPGYRSIRIAPKPGGGLTRASADLTTPYGRLLCGWEIANGQFTLRLTVPHNTTAAISLPDGSEAQTGSGEHIYTIPWA